MKTSPLRLPRRFFYDHAERDLPTPVVIRKTRSHVFVDGNDPNIAELINDAEHYADDYGPYGGALLKKSAIATIRAYEKWCDDEHSRWVDDHMEENREPDPLPREYDAYARNGWDPQ